MHKLIKWLGCQPAGVMFGAMLALGAGTAAAEPEQAYQFQSLDFQLAVSQAAKDSPTPTNEIISPLKTTVINNKYLLRYLAAALQTNWPAGAQLALDNLRRDLFVVDKTGTNPVFNLGAGINVGDTNVVYFTHAADEPLLSARTVIYASGSTALRVTDGHNYGMIFFHLLDEQNGHTNTELYFEGINSGAFHTDLTTVSNRLVFPYYSQVSGQTWVMGDGFLNGRWAVVQGTVSETTREYLGQRLLAPPIIPSNLPPVIVTNIPPVFITNILPPIVFTDIPPIIIITNPSPPILISL